MDDLIIVVKLLLLFVIVGIICCTFLSWHWWSTMMNSKWISKMEEEIKEYKSMKESDDDTLG